MQLLDCPFFFFSDAIYDYFIVFVINEWKTSLVE